MAQGTVTSPKGFLAGATYAGLKTEGAGKLDLGLLFSERPCLAAGVFTTNKIKAAPVLVSQKHLARGQAQAVVVNAGIANAGTGEQGLKDAEAMARLAGERLKIEPARVLVASTGVIGVPLPMEKIRLGLDRLLLSREGGYDLARAMMTTDAFPKEKAVSLEIQGKSVTLAGVAKGAGMIHPNLATMLCFLTTDAALEPAFLKEALHKAVNNSFNMITVDGDTSPNDTVLLLANGLADNAPLGKGSPDATAFQEALTELCTSLAKDIVRGAEGATKLIEITVAGARNQAEARQAARTIAGSSLVKAAVYGNDPNWGRVLAALGRSGAEVVESRIGLHLNGIALMKGGHPLPFDRAAASRSMMGNEVVFRVALNLGRAKATAWGCDLTEDYVKINSEYTT